MVIGTTESGDAGLDLSRTGKQGKVDAALLITSYLLYGACMLALVLYGIYKYTVFITVAVTLCGALLAMLAVFLGANLWFERRG